MKSAEEIRKSFIWVINHPPFETKKALVGRYVDELKLAVLNGVISRIDAVQLLFLSIPSWEPAVQEPCFCAIAELCSDNFHDGDEKSEVCAH